MNIEEVIQSDKVDFSGIPSNYYLLGLISAFENRFQAMADNTMQEISWKQFFAIICINMCKEPPTLKELSDVLGSSHQNVKQILLKLEKKDFIRFQTDETDKRKQRILLTEHCMEFCEKNNDMSRGIMEKMFGGIAESDIETTIQTIIRIEKNLRSFADNE
ncbi:MAG: MarR family transcriptional regulator [Eubacterium sp.]|nr:MarR family transcriptional regulator [Eubacterium sp.]MBR1675089.1 MarR family transcriptional regulator [Eubacterium sp.]